VQGNRSRGRSTFHSSVVTGISTAAVSGSAALAGVVLSRTFGHGAETDGFFAAYAVYLALVLVASALRVVVLPAFVRAEGEGRLAGESGTWLVALAVVFVPAVAVAIAWPNGIAGALTGGSESRHAAAELIPWLVPAAAAQVGAGVLASVLAACDSFVTAASAFAGGAIVGVVGIFALRHHGVVAFGWGLALNAAIAAGVLLVAVLRRSRVGRPDRPPLRRLWQLVEGVALPFALQGLYVVAVRFASGLGTGKATTFSYAYLIAATLVAVTATSFALVATVPFARSGADPARVARHVGAVSWLSLAVVAAAAGFFALAGEPVARHVLGSSYGGGTGTELGRLVVYLAPWMVVAVAVTVTFPLIFVQGRARWLPLAAVGALLLQVLVEWAGRAIAGLAGLAGGMAVTTAVVLALLLGALHALGATVARLGPAALVCGALAAVAFGVPALLLGSLVAAVVGLVLYAAALAVWRPSGLRAAWGYVRSLE
jgi:O-antigen/teichoic acid export membrane protein